MSLYFKSTGFVYGNLWGGGRGAYPAEKLENKTLKGLLKEACKGLKEGSLDSGMGYESLIGAVLEVEEIETITKNGKRYSCSEYNLHTIGKLNEEEIEFLKNCIY